MLFGLANVRKALSQEATDTNQRLKCLKLYNTFLEVIEKIVLIKHLKKNKTMDWTEIVDTKQAW